MSTWKEEIEDIYIYRTSDGVAEVDIKELESFIEQLLKNRTEEIITHIAKEQDWLDSEEHYRDFFGLEPKKEGE